MMHITLPTDLESLALTEDGDVGYFYTLLCCLDLGA